MIAPLSFAEGPGVNVLKSHQKGAGVTLLESSRGNRYSDNRLSGFRPGSNHHANTALETGRTRTRPKLARSRDSTGVLSALTSQTKEFSIRCSNGSAGDGTARQIRCWEERESVSMRAMG